MPEPVGPAERNGLVDGRQPERLAGVNREASIVGSHVFECVQMARRRKAGLGTGDIKADNAGVPVADCQFGDRPRPRGMTHRGHQAPHHDRPAAGRRGLLAVGESGQHRLDHLVERQSAAQVQLGREPDLRVDDIVGGEILHAFHGNPVQRLRGLHHRDGMGERFQVAHQRTAVRRGAEPGRQLGGVGARQTPIADLAGQVDDGVGP